MGRTELGGLEEEYTLLKTCGMLGGGAWCPSPTCSQPGEAVWRANVAHAQARETPSERVPVWREAGSACRQHKEWNNWQLGHTRKLMVPCRLDGKELKALVDINSTISTSKPCK
ncbi:hypothetical protein MHYP_G00315450 [Metynnis hypsauchen]